MSKKKDSERGKLSAEEALSKRVDIIMDPDIPDPATKTAPEVAGDLLKKVDADTDAGRQLPPAEPKAPKKTDTPPESEQEPFTPTPTKQYEAEPLDDQETDRAVDDIAAHESDTILALQDAIVRKKSHQADNISGHKGRTAGWIVLLLAAIVIFLLIAPYSRYTCRWPVGIRLRLTTDILPSVCK